VNRYTAEGVAADVEDGREVLVLALQPRAAMDTVLAQLQLSDLQAILRANGSEEIRHRAGGRVRFFDLRDPAILRGRSADVIVCDGPMLADHHYRELELCLSGPDGEIIR
jgi:hypothetical protein